jgi:hypothetical protein
MEGKYPPPPVKGTFMGMVYLREELFRGLSQAYNGGVCVVAMFVAFCRVFGDKSWDSEKTVVTPQSVSESEQLIWGGEHPVVILIEYGRRVLS